MSWAELFQPPVLFALFGGLAIQVLGVLELQNIPKIQRTDLRDPIYWLSFVLMPFLGGGLVLAYIYPNSPMEPLLAVNIGVSAPLILRAMAKVVPKDTAMAVPPGA